MFVIASRRRAVIGQGGERAARPAGRRTFGLGIVLADSLAVSLAVVVADAIVAANGDGRSWAGSVPSLTVCVVAALWMLGLGIARSRDERVLGYGSAEFARLAAGSLGWFAGVAVLGVLVDVEPLTALAAWALIIGAGVLAAERLVLRAVLRARRRSGTGTLRALVVGGDDAAALARVLRERPEIGLDPHLIVEAEECAVAELADRAAAAGCDAVVLAARLPGGWAAARQLGWLLEDHGIELVVSPATPDVSAARVALGIVRGSPVLRIPPRRATGPAFAFKSVCDRVGAGVALLALAPVAAVIAFAVLFDDGAPILFRQTRIGKDGRPFAMLKFRTMGVDAEQRLPALAADNEAAGPLFKVRADPRVTRVGRVLRRSSLDELPQLWNVLIGQMSLVGPRPALPREVETYDGVARRRLLARPGLTGLWQVSGRSDLDWEDGLRYDLAYVDNWSLPGDLVILARTAEAVVRSRGAY